MILLMKPAELHQAKKGRTAVKPFPLPDGAGNMINSSTALAAKAIRGYFFRGNWIAAWAAASRAMGTLKGEQLT
jgi:hypothetical protein